MYCSLGSSDSLVAIIWVTSGGGWGGDDGYFGRKVGQTMSRIVGLTVGRPMSRKVGRTRSLH
jgi:hypothetical protein